MITRAQIRRQLRKNGGIMNAVPRQGYFLGGVGDFIGSALGKAKDVVSNVVKSPVGKAALLGLGAYGLGGGFGGNFGLGNIGAKIGGAKNFLFGTAGLPGSRVGEAFSKYVPGTKGALAKMGLTGGFGSKMPTAFGGITGASLLTYFMSKGKTEEEAKELAQDVYRGKGLGLDLIQADMKNYRSGALSGSQAYDKGYRFLTPRNYMQAATGGRAGFQDGTPEEGIKSLDAGASSIKREGDVYPMDDDITTQMYISDELGALPKKDGGVLPEDMGKLTITDFESKEDYGRYLRVLNQKAQGGRIGYQEGGIGRWNPDKSLIQTGVNSSGFPIWHDPNEAAAMGIFPTTDYEGNKIAPASTPVAGDKSFLDKTVKALTGEHFGAEGNREKLLDAMDRGLIDEKEYKLMSGYDARKEMGMTPVQTLQSSGIYNVAKGVVSPEDFEGGIGPIQSTILNAIGSTGYGFDKDKFSGILDLSSEALSEDPYASSYGSQIAQKVGGAPAYDEMTPGMQAMQTRGIDPRMGRSYQENIQAMVDPRMRGPMGAAKGGRIGRFGGGIGAAMPRIPTGMPRVNAGGISELDYRASGGFVPVGVKEKADDVPAMLSKNEFVMTADAVKGAGGGNVEKGAQKMYNTMKQLEGRIA